MQVAVLIGSLVWIAIAVEVVALCFAAAAGDRAASANPLRDAP